MAQIKIVNDFRDSKENEFFFRDDPTQTHGTMQLFDWLEKQGFEVGHIPQWQIQTTHNGFDNYRYGVRIIKK
jgi:hypothetical protein|tara:strand:- start:195 stop:410 length:216 start_codon:yes stop_codon:yes gene_type:complete